MKIMIKSNILFLFSFFSIYFSIFIPYFASPLISLLFLLLLIITCFCFFLTLQIEYIAFTFLIIYGGALLVLFIFLIVITVKDSSLSFNFYLIPDYNSILIFFFLIFGMFLIFNKNYKYESISLKDILNNSPDSKISLILDNANLDFIFSYKYKSNDIFIISDLLYTNYWFFLLSIFFLFFFSMLNTICLIRDVNKNPIVNVKYSKKKYIYAN